MPREFNRQDKEGAHMGVLQRFGEMYRKWRRGAIPSEICEVCGEELEIDPESGEGHCPVCENPER
ncbi:MAG: hypothetical protein FD174_323 [Geobacteraceae bacterium]|nr:MAG: hypothetical protein FD174_323 [Geobacteraceae bacterium]